MSRYHEITDEKRPWGCSQCGSETWGVECSLKDPDMYDGYDQEISDAVDRVASVVGDRDLALRALKALYWIKP